MHSAVLASTLACAVLLTATPAHAQQPAGAPASPPAAPPAPPYGTPITLEQARAAATAAEAEARRSNFTMVIAIVEPTGALVYLSKMDGTQYASIDVAQAKARSSATFRRPTKAFADALQGGNQGIVTLPGAVAIEGGVPLIANGRLIGAIGVSGATAAQDGVVARAGAATLR